MRLESDEDCDGNYLTFDDNMTILGYDGTGICFQAEEAFAGVWTHNPGDQIHKIIIYEGKNW